MSYRGILAEIEGDEEVKKIIVWLAIQRARFAIWFFFGVFKWAWKSWKTEIDIMPPDENGALVGMKITIGDFVEEKHEK